VPGPSWLCADHHPDTCSYTLSGTAMCHCIMLAGACCGLLVCGLQSAEPAAPLKNSNMPTSRSLCSSRQLRRCCSVILLTGPSLDVYKDIQGVVAAHPPTPPSIPSPWGVQRVTVSSNEVDTARCRSAGYTEHTSDEHSNGSLLHWRAGSSCLGCA
jgi:hypothetical protein